MPLSPLRAAAVAAAAFERLLLDARAGG